MERRYFLKTHMTSTGAMATAANNFLNEFKHIPDVSLIAELQQLWEGWQQNSVSFKKVEFLADRLVGVARHINNQYFSNGRG